MQQSRGARNANVETSTGNGVFSLRHQRRKRCIKSHKSRSSQAIKLSVRHSAMLVSSVQKLKRCADSVTYRETDEGADCAIDFIGISGDYQNRRPLHCGSSEHTHIAPSFRLPHDEHCATLRIASSVSSPISTSSTAAIRQIQFSSFESGFPNCIEGSDLFPSASKSSDPWDLRPVSPDPPRAFGCAPVTVCAGSSRSWSRR